VAAGGRAIDFYVRCGWQPVETVSRVGQESATVLTKLW